MEPERAITTSLNSIAAHNILVIEDDIDHLRMLSDLLTRSGYQVRPTSSGKAGLRAARLMPPDLILLDVKLPDMDGFTVCRTLKADSLLIEIPVIFISGLDDVDSQAKGFQAGGRDYITKPFNEVVVLTRIQNQIQIQRLQREQRANAQQSERQRIARELHDSVNQTLFILGSTVQSLLLTDNNLTPALADQLNYVHRLSLTATNELRILLYELRPDVLRQASLSQLIRHLVQSLQLRTDAEFSVLGEDDETLIEVDEELKVVLYRIAQEALVNAVKHASARHIVVRTVGDIHNGMLQIEDDGVGLAATAPNSVGMGIANMRERASARGIGFSIESVPRHGTRIIASWQRE